MGDLLDYPQLNIESAAVTSTYYILICWAHINFPKSGINIKG